MYNIRNDFNFNVRIGFNFKVHIFSGSQYDDLIYTILIYMFFQYGILKDTKKFYEPKF